MEETGLIDNFFKSSTLFTNQDSLVLQNVLFERIYFDHYSSLINVYKKNTILNISEDRSLKKSSWEPMLKTIHNGSILSLFPFLTIINNRTESGILMDLFHILQLSGFGTFQLSLPVPGSIMTISVKNSVESYSDMVLGIEPEKTLSVFSAGIVLSCYNLAMSTSIGSGLDEVKATEIYNNSPDIIQINNDGIDSEVIFALKL